MYLEICNISSKAPFVINKGSLFSSIKTDILRLLKSKGKSSCFLKLLSNSLARFNSLARSIMAKSITFCNPFCFALFK